MRRNIKKEALLIFFLLIISTIPRVIFLDKIPPGIHGDEGWTGIDARIILKKGYIEPYVASALGQPTGPLYLTSLLFKFFGETIFTLRLSMTIFGILTVPLLYIFLRIFTERKSAILTTVAFNFSLFHLSYSRIAFMLISAPFFQLISLILFLYGKKTKKYSFFMLSAIFTGLGIYSYNAFILFPLTLFLMLIFDIIRKKSSYDFKKFIFFSIFFSIVTFPLIKIILTKPTFYFSHHKLYSILNKPEVKEEKELLKKIKLIFINGINNTKYFFFGEKIDYVDAFGKYQSFNKFYLILFLLGLIISLVKKEKYSLFFLFSMAFFIFGNFLTFEGVYRRQILNLVNFFYFFNLAINYICQKFKKKYNFLIFSFFTVVILFLSKKNLELYFNHYPFDPETKFVFCKELTQTSLKLKSLYEPPIPVFFFSSRWSCNYETVRFLIPQLNCQDLSEEFREQEYTQIECKKCFFVFLNNYLDNITMIKRKYPSGKEIRVVDENNEILGIVYFVK